MSSNLIDATNIRQIHNPSDFDVPLEWLYKGKSKRKSKSSSRLKSSSSSNKLKKLKNSSSNDPFASSTTDNQKQRSTSISNAALSSNHIPILQKPGLVDSNENAIDDDDDDEDDNNVQKDDLNNLHALTPTTTATTMEPTMVNSTSKKLVDEEKSNLPSRSSKRNRSISISNAIASSNNSKSKNTPSTISSTSDPPPTIASAIPTFNSIKRNNSTNSNNGSTKKSLFGSIFGRGSSTSNSKTKPQLATPSASAPTPTPKLNTALPSNSKTLKKISKLNSMPQSDHPKETTPISAIYTSSSESTDSTPSNDSAIVSTGTPATSMNTLSSIPSIPSMTIKDLSNVTLKRVSFAVDKFDNDPAQQLPSRTPKTGKVLVPDDMISDLPSISIGISNTIIDDGKFMNQRKITKNSKEYKIAMENHRFALKEAAKHQQEAHFAAKRIANEVSNFKSNGTSNSNNNPVNELRSHLNDKINKIDNPIHIHEHHFEEKINNNEETQEITLDIIYTRCCHLREILPIPSTLRQVVGKTSPLQILKFLNPKPTLIDVLSFADFISIVPINTIIFDNVTLTSNMLKIIITSLVKSQNLEKLGLRNVIIDNENWKLLCKFLLNNKSLTKLDISQTKIRSEISSSSSSPSQTLASSSNMIPVDEIYRHNKDWSLFVDVLRNRDGKPLEELLLNGIKFNKIPLTILQNLLNGLTNQKNSPPKGIRLGLATSDLSLDCVKILLSWWSKNTVQGIDLSFNDLSEYVKPMISKLASLSFESLEYFTLNNTSISTGYDMALFLKYLSRLPNLKFLDLSNLPQIFPDVLPYMHKYLPKFKHLKRIHLDNNNLSFKELTVVCNILLKCQSLAHVSMLSQGTSSITNVAIKSAGSDQIGIQETSSSSTPSQFAKNTFCATLYAFAKDSSNLVGLDIDYDQIPDEIQQRIALCLMRNMNRAMDSTFQLDELTSQDDLLFDGTLITENAEDVLAKLNKLNAQNQTGTNVNGTNGTGQSSKDDVTKRYLLKKYVEKIHKVHYNVQEKIDSMFEKRNSGELTLVEKENLLRLILLDKNLSNIIEILSDLTRGSDFLGMSTNNSKGSISSIKSNDHADDTINNHTMTNDTVAYADGDIDSQRKPILRHVECNNPEEIQTPETETMARPHLMATDSGRTIDVLTGKPVLFRRSSTTSVVGKRQEMEEGELHKWGFFVQQQRAIYPDNDTSIKKDTIVPAIAPPVKPTLPVITTATANVEITPVTKTLTTPTTPTTTTRILPKIPSGAELRNAIIKAKGIDSIDDLIQNVTENEVELLDIYGKSVQSKLHLDTASSAVGNEDKKKAIVDSPTITTPTKKSVIVAKLKPVMPIMKKLDNDDDSGNDGCNGNGKNCEKTVTEAYDKLLNDLSVNRPSKT
ncbi:protein phosphatase regulator GIP3 NDAI_0E02290 [Naumovozyma dairenensis CBS 421]|uniref:GLC7-interacting protein 3 n=1 Tax=Naumovozyma dairenensis (strain ATCC 10597 / BCRC 20456 / CBS 421 / NBRC 0211 / NRRL Y-12639) TaxID=1071378 RepID=G0WBC6_NAUDC|nr:hypothetical protein NDAI_0E02290 [Naumovozyma dairenensis CBS 421]CCD25046.1 hypothetical protein NDAI_0E02290 [Naumovozyma dairenensis CBS 421]